MELGCVSLRVLSLLLQLPLSSTNTTQGDAIANVSWQRYYR